MSRNVATLLEQNLDKRHDAINFVTGLYKRRCKALHGESLETEEKDAQLARRLSAAVLHAAVEFHCYEKSCGFPSERNKIIDELDRHLIAGKKMPDWIPRDLATFVHGQ